MPRAGGLRLRKNSIENTSSISTLANNVSSAAQGPSRHTVAARRSEPDYQDLERRPPRARDVLIPDPSLLNDLYASQAEVLDGWYNRRTEKDLVVKLHTGSGKTLVGVLIAQSVMNETGEPVIYLAPTNQLVDKVLAKSREYGIPALPYTKGRPLPAEFYDGKSVLVGAHETLFNDRSKLGVRGSGQEVVKAGAIIFDDAPVPLRSVREEFTLRGMPFGSMTSQKS